MSAKKRPENKQTEDKTTLRMTCTPDEHDAVKRFVKYKCGGITIDAFIRESLDKRLSEVCGKSLHELAEGVRNVGKLIQGELFE